MLRFPVLLLFIWFITTSYVISTGVTLEIKITEEPEVPYLKSTLSLEAGKTYHVDAGQLFTALKITTLDTTTNQIDLSLKKETYQFGTIVNDENIDIPPSFIIPLKPYQYFSISSVVASDITIEFFYAPSLELNIPSNKSKSTLCQKPTIISSALWRDGLPDPKPGRVTSEVKHCIIHHSAGNTADTNYTNIIRNIYLLHTQSNGWDDIGYNFVIASNGAIYEGRDPQGVGEIDDIQGAHFCAKNSGTMGICLLGNYEIDTPSTAIKTSLENLLTWKLYKEDISAKDSSIHPLSGNTYLGSISQHKDGCPTLCPGKNTTQAIAQIKENVQNELDRCASIVSTPEPQNGFFLKVYPNPSDGRFYVMTEKEAGLTHYELNNATGKLVERKKLADNGLIRTDLNSGYYTLTLWNKKTLIFRKTILIK
jgi:hypothetical protein